MGWNEWQIGEKGPTATVEPVEINSMSLSLSRARRPTVVSLPPDLEARVVRKLDMRMIPLLAFLYLLSFVDRSTIGFAKTAGLGNDIDLSGNNFALLLVAFYITYICCGPLVLMWKVWPPHIWATLLMAARGLAVSAQAGVTNYAGMVACRAIIGIGGSTMNQGLPYFLSFFYLRHEIGRRVGFLMMIQPLAGGIAGLIAFGLSSGHEQIAPWRLLFLVEGIPAILMAPIVYFCLPDQPDQARYLSSAEKLAAKTRGVRQVGDKVRIGGIDWREVKWTLQDWKYWLMAAMAFGTTVSAASLPVFLPTIIADMGYTLAHAEGMTAPPLIFAALIVVLSTWIADKYQQRSYVIAVSSFTAVLGYVIMITCKGHIVPYLATFLTTGGVHAALSNTMPWVTNNQGSDTRRGVGMAMITSIGQCGSMLGINSFNPDEGPRYVRGHFICAVAIGVVTVIALVLRVCFVLENRRLDRKYASNAGATDSDASSAEMSTAKTTLTGIPPGEEPAAVEDFGPDFRYIL